jgi:hypothetical protein
MEEGGLMARRRRDEDRQVTEAFLNFHDSFSSYIKEMDAELWKRAVDYAVTYTEGVRFEYDAAASGCTGSREDRTGS